MATVTISWSLSLCRLLAKHKDTLLASKTSPYSVVNFDPTVRPPKRFGDDETEERVVLLGRIPYVYPGLKVDIRGDRDRDRNRIMRPMEDGEVVNDVIPLGNAFGDINIITDVWKKQIKVIEALEAIEETRIDNTPIMDAPLRFHSLIKSDTSRQPPRDKLEIIWDKFETVNDENAGRLVRDRQRRNVKEGALYVPTVLEHGGEPFCLMRNDAVRQHIILDEYEHLIPPWELANEIRPGSIMLVVAAIWEVNRPIVGSKEGYFERHYELRGRWAQVLRRGNGHPSSCSPPFLYNRKLLSCENALVRQRVLTEFKGFKVKVKGKDDKADVTDGNP